MTHTLARLLHTRVVLDLPPAEHAELRDGIAGAYGIDELSPDVRALIEVAARELALSEFETKEARSYGDAA